MVLAGKDMVRQALRLDFYLSDFFYKFAGFHVVAGFLAAPSHLQQLILPSKLVTLLLKYLTTLHRRATVHLTALLWYSKSG